ncbi:MAG: NERD domain-containing protein [Flavobacteriaceae bacterium]|nr:NERD domain-containing protein [Flavobacteriaceae bacterium]
MLYPNNVQRYKSTGEKILAQKFEIDLKMQEAYVLPSVFCSQHFKKVSGELDFLVLMPKHGFFALEVKHGKVERKNGKWFYTNKDDKKTIANRSPFDQVNKTMQAIKGFVDRKIIKDPVWNKQLKRKLWGYGVCFTGIKVDAGLFEPEGEKWQIFDRDQISKPISQYIEKLSWGWHHKYRNTPSCRWYSNELSRPSEHDCYRLFQLLRGDFEFDYSEINRLGDSKNLIDQYTHEQFDILEQTRYNPRVLIEGPAGTGKTLMAIEMVQRKVFEGKTVGLMCFTNSLSNDFKNRFKQLKKDHPNLRYVKTFHSFMYDHIDTEIQVDKMTPEEKSQFFDEGLPLEFIIEASTWTENKKLDYLVIDEAQDLVKSNYLDVIDMALKGGIEKGSFLLVGDFYRQGLFNELNGDQLIRLMTNRTGLTILKLTINCRNTKEIALFASKLSGYPSPNAIHKSITGKKVDLRFPIESKLMTQVITVLKDIQQRIPLEKVTILTHRVYNKTVLKGSKEIKNLMNTQGLTHSTIKSFKGLENDIIILISDCNESNFKEKQNALYVACTRANHQLYVFFTRKLKALIQGQLNKVS